MKDQYLIFGGQMNNKGAQAMTFITVQEMAERYPQLKPVAVIPKATSGDPKQYCFRIIKPLRFKEKMIVCLPLLAGLYSKIKPNSNVKKYYDLLRSCAVQIDISGYMFGANWGVGNAISFLLRIAMAKAYHIPVYLMPQSFGPFDFRGFGGFVVRLLAKHYFPYCKVIMARELESKEGMVGQYHLQNVIQTPDLVLQNSRRPDMQTIFRVPAQRSSLKIEPQSTAIIPNTKNNKYGDPQQIFQAYCTAIEHLLKLGRNVYLLYHSSEDAALCRELERAFEQNDHVRFVSEELNCIDFDCTVSQFDYIIASRFHSIVHAYKNCVPAVVLGWATKYRELTEMLEQERYQLDVRGGLSADALIEKIDEMEKAYSNEHQIIRDKITEIQKENVFDKIVL